MIKVVTIVEQNQALTLIKEGTVKNINTIPHLNPLLLDRVRKFIYENVGYESAPIACMSKVYENDGELSRVWSEISTFIPTSSNTVMFEFHMPNDMVVSVSYEEILDFSKRLEGLDNEFFVETILQEFQDKLTLGDLEGDNVLSFVPFLDKKKCKFFALLNENWDRQDIDLGDIKKVDLKTLSIF